MRPHIDAMWGWDNQWQNADFANALHAASTTIVEVDGNFAGYMQIDPGPADHYLRMFILDPAWQNLGIGAVLLAQLLRTCRDKGRGLGLRVFRTNLAAKRFYERHGWLVAADQGDFFQMKQPPSLPSWVYPPGAIEWHISFSI